MKSGSQAYSISKQCDGSSDISTIFWQQWQQYRDYLYRCCIKWMGGNSTDAEDALSRAMLKAWEKVQKYAAGEIANFKSWLTSLTHNLCVDIYRERSRGANRVEDIEAIGEEQGLVSFDDTPESAMETGEKRMVIRRAIANLPTRLRETFILHFDRELSYPEIAQQQDSVGKVAGEFMRSSRSPPLYYLRYFQSLVKNLLIGNEMNALIVVIMWREKIPSLSRTKIENTRRQKMPKVINNDPSRSVVYLIVRKTQQQIEGYADIKNAALKGGVGNYILQPGGYQEVQTGQWIVASTSGNQAINWQQVTNEDVRIWN